MAGSTDDQYLHEGPSGLNVAGKSVPLITEPKHARRHAELRNPAWVKISQIRTLSVQRTGKHLAPRVAPVEVTQIVERLVWTSGE